MKKLCAFLTLSFLLGMMSIFGQDEKITVTIGGMSMADVPFKIENIRTANNKLVKVEAVSDMQVRFLGLALGKTDVQGPSAIRGPMMGMPPMVSPTSSPVPHCRTILTMWVTASPMPWRPTPEMW